MGALRAEQGMAGFERPVERLKEGAFTLELEIDFEPGQVHFLERVFETLRQVDAIFFRGNKQIPRMRTSLMSQASDLDGSISVVIGKRPTIDDIQAERIESIPKILRIA
jgi:hypothetical protein